MALEIGKTPLIGVTRKSGVQGLSSAQGSSGLQGLSGLQGPADQISSGAPSSGSQGAIGRENAVPGRERSLQPGGKTTSAGARPRDATDRQRHRSPSDSGSTGSGTGRAASASAGGQTRPQPAAASAPALPGSSEAAAANGEDAARHGQLPAPNALTTQGAPARPASRGKSGRGPSAAGSSSSAAAAPSSPSGAAALPGGGGATGAAATDGLNFLQTLAESLHAGAAAAATAADGAVASRPAVENARATDTGSDTLELSLTVQSLAALLGLPPACLPAPAGERAGTPADPAPAAVADATVGTTNQTAAMSIQDSAALLLPMSTDPAHGSGSVTIPTATQAAIQGHGSAAAAGAPTQIDMSALGAALTSIATSGPSGAHSASAHSMSAPGMVSANLRASVGSPAWTEELGGQLTWMAHQGLQSASLRLSPEHLGPLEVRISVQDGGATVLFGAAQADTRAALEHALPRLSELFAGQGLTLADASVSREPPRDSAKSGPTLAVPSITAIGASDTPVSSTRTTIGLVDTYV